MASTTSKAKVTKSAKTAEVSPVNAEVTVAAPVEPTVTESVPVPVEVSLPPLTKSTQVPEEAPSIETEQLKETTMAKTTPADFTAAFTTAFSDFQGKAKEAYEKGTAAATEAGEFAKGNAEALVESGKILVEGLKGLGSELVEESKTAFSTVTADVKELAAIKSPADFFKFQSELLRRNFDAAVAYSAKSTEAAVKLANEVVAPLSTRVSLAVEKVSKAA